MCPSYSSGKGRSALRHGGLRASVTHGLGAGPPGLTTKGARRPVAALAASSAERAEIASTGAGSRVRRCGCDRSHGQNRSISSKFFFRSLRSRIIPPIQTDEDAAIGNGQVHPVAWTGILHEGNLLFSQFPLDALGALQGVLPNRRSVAAAPGSTSASSSGAMWSGISFRSGEIVAGLFPPTKSGR